MICDVIENKDTEFVKVKTETLENDILNIDEKNNEQIQIDPLSDSNIKLEQFDENLVSEEISNIASYVGVNEIKSIDSNNEVKSIIVEKIDGKYFSKYHLKEQDNSEIDPFCDIKSEQFDGGMEVNNIQSEIVINLEIQ